MARGNIAKEKVTKKIIEVFGKDFITETDKKLYLWADDGGEKVQIAISMTCPKNPVGEVPIMTASDSAFEVSATPAPTNVEITAEETETLEALMKKLGL